MGHMRYMVKIMLWDQQRINLLKPEHPDLISKVWNWNQYWWGELDEPPERQRDCSPAGPALAGASPRTPHAGPRQRSAHGCPAGPSRCGDWNIG